MINYWCVPNMGKMHLMQLIEIHKKSYVKSNTPYYIYKQWHDPNDYKKRIEKTFVLRKGHSELEGVFKTKTTFGEMSDDFFKERHEYLNEVHGLTTDRTKFHSNTIESGADLMKKYFGAADKRTPPDVLMNGRDPVEIFFTDKWIAEIQKYFPVSPSKNYYGTFLEPYMREKAEVITPIIDELCDVDFILEPGVIMGRYMSGNIMPKVTDAGEDYIIEKYKKANNIISYKEDLLDCFTSKLCRYWGGDVSSVYKKDKRIIWNYLDGFVRGTRRIEWYLKTKGIERNYFNLDRDDYNKTFGFQKEFPRDHTHPGDFPKRKEYESIVKDYLTIRNLKDMRKRGIIHEKEVEGLKSLTDYTFSFLDPEEAFWNRPPKRIS